MVRVVLLVVVATVLCATGSKKTVLTHVVPPSIRKLRRDGGRPCACGGAGGARAQWILMFAAGVEVALIATRTPNGDD